MHSFVITTGNVRCWDAEFQYHTCCLSHESRTLCFSDQMVRAGITFDACCRRQQDSRVLTAVPLWRHQPRGCFPPYCQTTCLGFGAEYFSNPPQWVEEAPQPTPLSCGDAKIWPLTLSVPRSLLVECLPAKSADFAFVKPGDATTYIFGGDEREYFRSYRESLFALTMVKGGADCARHTEILASGTLPYFARLESVPNHTMAHHHRGLLQEALELPGVRPGFLLADEFDAAAWLRVASALLQWTTHRLTTDAMAKYFLSILGIPDEAFSSLRVLYLWHNPPLPLFLLHGLREVLQPEHVVDFPRAEGFYEPTPWPAGEGSRPAVENAEKDGLNYLSARWFLRPTAVFAEGEAAVLDAIQRGQFDYVIFSKIPAELESDRSPVEATALRSLPQRSLILVDHHDHMPTTLREWARRMGTTFKYNLADKC